mgnify:CR=1 FL=1
MCMCVRGVHRYAWVCARAHPCAFVLVYIHLHVAVVILSLSEDGTRYSEKTNMRENTKTRASHQALVSMLKGMGIL